MPFVSLRMVVVGVCLALFWIVCFAACGDFWISSPRAGDVCLPSLQDASVISVMTTIDVMRVNLFMCAFGL